MNHTRRSIFELTASCLGALTAIGSVAHGESLEQGPEWVTKDFSPYTPQQLTTAMNFVVNGDQWSDELKNYMGSRPRLVINLILPVVNTAWESGRYPTMSYGDIVVQAYRHCRDAQCAYNYTQSRICELRLIGHRVGER